MFDRIQFFLLKLEVSMEFKTKWQIQIKTH